MQYIMKIKRLLFGLAVGFLAVGGFVACESPTDYTVYGIIYTDQTMSVPLKNARLELTMSDYDTKGYATSDSVGRFSFFFWDDGNGVGQEITTRKGGSYINSAGQTVYTQPVSIMYNGKVLFKSEIEVDRYTKENPLLLYPGCYTGKEGRDE